MENREYLNSLFDIYGSLLTNVEKETFTNYYVEDLSLSEIASIRNISKSSVGKTLNEAENKLKYYEDNLKYQEKINKINEILNKDLDINTLKKEIIDIIK